MPWTADDASKHKKGLSPKQAKQWARIANSVLKRCMAKGGTEETCAASAIKQANGVVNVNMDEHCATYTSKQVEYELRFTTHQGRPHIILPVVMMVEGVHHGSQGPLLHSIEDLGKFPESWNGIPVVIYHPTDNGTPVSANSPEIIDTQTVGRVYNTQVEGKKLKAEVWLDEEQLNAVSPRTLEMINGNEAIEVSLGMFTENEEVEGEWNGEKYTAIAHNHRPDHLALLPDQVGACSCADGCGLGVNEEDMKIEELITKVRTEGYAVHQLGVNFTGGFKERMEKVQEILRGYDSDRGYNYLEDMDEKFFVYVSSNQKEIKMYRQEYRFESGKIVLIDDPVEVHRKVDYIVNVEQKKEEKMANSCTPCVKKKVDELIANSQGKYTEGDREQLETLNEALLDKIATPVEVEKEVIKEVNVLSDAQKAAIAAFEKAQKEKRDNFVKGILDNTDKVWTEDKLKEMSDEILEGIYKSVVKEEHVVDYSALAGRSFQANSGDDVEPLLPPDVESKK
jgi:hypothetical protein